MSESHIIAADEVVGSAVGVQPQELYGIKWNDGERFTRPIQISLRRIVTVTPQGETDGAIDN